MKKIMLVLYEGLGNGGGQAVVMNIVRNLHQEYTFDILLFTDEKRYHEDEFESYGGKIFRIPYSKGKIRKRLERYINDIKTYRILSKILKENGEYMAIHCHNEIKSAVCLMAAKHRHVPIRVAHTHVIQQGGHIVWNLYSKLCYMLIDKYATHKIACSEKTKENFKCNRGMMVINNPYDSKRFVFDEKFHLAGEEPVLTQIGYYSENKNQLFSLEVIAQLKKTYPGAKLNFIGFDSGNMLLKLKERVCELGLEDNVYFHPHDADSPEILKNSNYFLFPSMHEGFGMVLIEAQSVGVKCFAADTVPRETNCGGVIYLPLSLGAKVWADKITEDFKETKGIHKQYNCSLFSAENVVDTYRNIYEGKEKYCY